MYSYVESKREKRKNEHISIFENTKFDDIDYFDDILLINNSLPELSFDEISISSIFLNKPISMPIMINAITGGTKYSSNINKELAYLAKKFNIPIAVGSQSIAVKSGRSLETYSIVRKIVGDEGVVIANLSASAKLEEAISAINMLNADAIQLHLNVAQEICMPEGERNFKGITKNIEQIVSKINKPVIVKEVGFGISDNACKTLSNIGVKYIDVSGKGGTNFIKIEDMRNMSRDYADMYFWGIPTPLSIRLCRNISPELNIICSGGIKKADQIVKSLCLGCNIVGISGYILRILLQQGYDQCERELENISYKIKVLMLLLGCKKIKELNCRKILVKNQYRKL